MPRLTGPAAGAVNRFDHALAQADAYLRALVTSINRTSAARTAGATAAMRMQQAAASRYAGSAAKTLRSLPALARGALAAGKRAHGSAAEQVALRGPLSRFASASFTRVLNASTAVLDAIGG